MTNELNVFHVANLKRDIPSIEIETEQDSPICLVKGEKGSKWGEKGEEVFIKRGEKNKDGTHKWFCIFKDSKVLSFDENAAKQYLITKRMDDGKPIRETSGKAEKLFKG